MTADIFHPDFMRKEAFAKAKAMAINMNKKLMDCLSPHTPEEEAALKGIKIEPEIFERSVVSSERIKRNGQQIVLSKHTRFTAFPDHNHEYIEVCYVCRGCLTHTVNKSDRITVNCGELLLLNRHAVHSIEYCGEEDIAVNFLILPSFFDTTMTLIGGGNPLGKFLINAVGENRDGINYLFFQVSDMPIVQNLVENMVISLLNEGMSTVKEEKLTMALLFLHLLGAPMAVKSPGENLVICALKEIEDNFQDAALSKVAAENHVSTAYLSKLIKEKTGSTFKAHLMEKRLSLAKSLIQETDMPISAVASAVGYENTSFFFRAFKQAFGVTPKEYRVRAFQKRE